MASHNAHKFEKIFKALHHQACLIQSTARSLTCYTHCSVLPGVVRSLSRLLTHPWDDYG